MGGKRRRLDRRALLDAKLTELMLLAKELCPEATVKADPFGYEEEDGHVDVFRLRPCPRTTSTVSSPRWRIAPRRSMTTRDSSWFSRS